MNSTELRLLPLLAFTVLFAAGVVFAQEPQITFPIDELGGCSSKDECKAYCDNGEHVDVCISFGESHGLMSHEEAERARTFSNQTGPGGCRGEACKTYCENPDHSEACIAFAEKHGFIEHEEAEKARTLIGKTGPGGCRGPECRVYCEAEEHFRECRAFAEENGLLRIDIRPEISVDEPQIDEDKAMQIVEAQGGPGGCKTKDECRAYCSDEAHMDACLAFAKEHKLMSDGDIERAEKFAHQKGPGGCIGEACKTFCENPDHAEECIAFAEENGFIKHEEAERAKAFIGKTGPGGCRGEECRTYCEDPARREACMQFATDNGLISKKDLERMRRHQDEFGNPDIFQGPGGCTNPKECRSYCENHVDECRGFGQGPNHPVGQERAIEKRGFETPPGLMEECRKNPEACREHFQKSGGSFPKLPSMSEDEKARMNKFMGRPEMNTQNLEYLLPYRPEEGMPTSGTEGYRPPEGLTAEQYNQKYQQPYDQQSQQYQQSTQYQLPPEGQTYAPLPSTSEPASGPTSSNFVASVFWIFAQLLGAR